MKEPWSLKSRSRTCHQTQRPFEDEEPIHVAIFPDPESSGYLRQDYAELAWAEISAVLKPFSSWRTIYKAPIIEEKADKAVANDPESLLRQLLEEDEKATLNTRYILALMLERRKILKEIDVQRSTNKGLLRLYEHRKTGEAWLVHDPEISLDALPPVQDEVAEFLANAMAPQPKPAVDAAAEATEPTAPATPAT